MTAYTDAKAAMQAVFYTGGPGRITPELAATAIISLTDALIASIPADRYLTGLSSYNATTNVLTLSMSDGSTVDVSMTALIADAAVATGGDLLAANNLSDLANAATARANLGLTIGTHVQAYDADLAAWAGLMPGASEWAIGSVTLYNEAANVLAQRNGTNAQTFRLYGTYTDAANHEHLQVKYDAGLSRYVISTVNAGTGANRDLFFMGAATSGFVYSRTGANVLQLGQGGVGTFWNLTSGSHLVPHTNNASDVGSAANKVRSLYLGTSIVFPDGTTQATAGGGLTEIGRVTVGAAVASVSWTSLAAFRSLKLVGVGISGSSTGLLTVEVSADNGATWVGLASGAWYQIDSAFGAVTGVPADGALTRTNMAAADVGSFTWEIHDAKTAAVAKRVEAVADCQGSGALYKVWTTGVTASMGAINAVRARFTAGNVDAGTIILYGA